jgi:prepilin-type N-terminal cleavage/methylation domain-containing protein
MIQRMWRPISRSQRGFTIVEMIVTLTLTALISLGASMASAQVLNQTSRNADYVTASRQAMNAIAWISRDAEMAQVVGGADTFPTGDLVFTWTTWEDDDVRAVYSLVDGQIMRTLTINDNEPSETVVAEYINPDIDLTNCVLTSDVLTVKITASVGQGSRVRNVTLIHDTSPRPRL